MLAKLKKYLNNQYERDEFVVKSLQSLPEGLAILDAGCGSQRYRGYCSHLKYFSQDFGKYKVDEKDGFTSGVGGEDGYRYGDLDYIGDIWHIAEEDRHFDAILCTEVLEHIPYPIDAIREFSRLIKTGGSLILTAPSNCLRHMDPFYFYTGFSDRFYEKILRENNFELISIEPVGDYYRWLCVELARTATAHSFVAKLFLAPSFLYFLLKSPTQKSRNTLCMGYHVIAKKMKQ
ncbi:MAG: class I SAM-dependent methyltransferase [Sulfuricaulis sp.]